MQTEQLSEKEMVEAIERHASDIKVFLAACESAWEDLVTKINPVTRTANIAVKSEALWRLSGILGSRATQTAVMDGVFFVSAFVSEFNVRLLVGAKDMTKLIRTHWERLDPYTRQGLIDVEKNIETLQGKHLADLLGTGKTSH